MAVGVWSWMCINGLFDIRDVFDIGNRQSSHVRTPKIAEYDRVRHRGLFGARLPDVGIQQETESASLPCGVGVVA